MNKLPIINSQRELTIALTAISLPFWLHLPAGVLLFFYLIIGIRFISLHSSASTPRPAILLLLTLCGGFIVWLQTGGMLGKLSWTSLLLVGTGLKLLEIKTQRDLYIAIALALLLVLTQFLFSQAIAMAVYLLAAVSVIMTVLMGMHIDTAVMPVINRLRDSAITLALSLPLAVLLFLLAPRINGPLWSLPEEKQVFTGLGDTLNPGSISQLTRSNEPAFRVNFVTDAPAQNQLYWRGPVFWWTDGRQWDMRHLPDLDMSSVVYRGAPLDYSIVLEPHGQKWLLALDLPQSLPIDSHLSLDFQLLSNNAVLDRRLYKLRSYPQYYRSQATAFERRLGLQLPRQSFERLRPLVASWRTGHNDEQVIQQALSYFRTQRFFYTLNPPLLGNHPIEQFLLETRRGFCEHYAGAFVVLMRLAGIPARIVTGYQGGQWNALGKFLEVRQSDAHAWAEVWLEQRGWVRIDPTAAVAPGRIEQPFDAEAIDKPVSSLPVWQTEVSTLWIKTARLFLANMDHGWHRWVLSYDDDARRKLLQWVGNGFTPGWLFWPCIGLFLYLSPWLWRYWRNFRFNQTDPILKYYRQFCAKLAASGLPRNPAEGPLHYAERSAKALPHLAQQIFQITHLYVTLRYGSVRDRELVQLLRLCVKQL